MDASTHVAHLASWTPGKAAPRFERRALRYADLEHVVSTGAARLLEQGVRAGDRVAVLGPNCPELLEMAPASGRMFGLDSNDLRGNGGVQPDPARNPLTPVLIAFTSGTAGRPKGALSVTRASSTAL